MKVDDCPLKVAGRELHPVHLLNEQRTRVVIGDLARVHVRELEEGRQVLAGAAVPDLGNRGVCDTHLHTRLRTAQHGQRLLIPPLPHLRQERVLVPCGQGPVQLLAHTCGDVLNVLRPVRHADPGQERALAGGFQLQKLLTGSTRDT
ncbi:hypothetical protein [Kitasatospora sp. NPDC059327]|uniref:hypothetical protein n=1 Tax=Kitasatospora sp. NPDC059327 TaxID=3346803 RepID=UPI00369E8020